MPLAHQLGERADLQLGVGALDDLHLAAALELGQERAEVRPRHLHPPRLECRGTIALVAAGGPAARVASRCWRSACDPRGGGATLGSYQEAGSGPRWLRSPEAAASGTAPRGAPRGSQGEEMGKAAFGVELFQYLDANTLVEEVQFAERLGYDSVGLGDSQLLWRELYVLLGAAAVTTSRILLASGVTNPVTRHPSVTASALLTLQELSNNRVILGIGVGFTSLSIMGLPPVPRAELRRYVEQVRALCRGETVQGERAAMRLAFGAPERCPPVVIPAAGPKMLRLAGEVGDGVILQSCPPFPGEVFQTMLGHVREGRAAAGRENEPFTVYHGLPAAVHSDRAVALGSVKSHVAVGLLKPR